MAENASDSGTQPHLETVPRENAPSSSVRTAAPADMKNGSRAQTITSEMRSTSPTAQDPSTSTGASVMSEAQEASDNAQSSSSLSAAQLQHSSEMSGPSPYGTRSRNRTGSTRPNYAEDKEVDMDFEWSSNKKTNTPITNSAQQVDSDNNKSSGPGTRRSTGNAGLITSKTGGAGSTAPKESIPGMSTFSVNSDSNATVPQGKKRKAPGGNMSALGVSGHSSSHGPGRKSHASTSTSNARESNMYSFDRSQGYLKHGKLKADDDTTFSINDYVYVVCEPPGEPYYLARIMEFLHMNNDRTQPVETLRINWVYRPRDIGRKVQDTRLVFVSMHSDTCPLTSLRGKCVVRHKSEIPNLDEYRKLKDSFWFSQMFDRYIRRYYEVIPTSQVINVPDVVKKVLDERWRFVIVESGRGKELTSAIKTCKRCSEYCASNDSVDCAMCKNTYHMNCVRPPLLKKPARGFAWSCAPCSRKQEKKLEARNTPIVGERALEGEEEEFLDEEEDEHGVNSNQQSGSSPEDTGSDNGPRPATAEQLAQAKLWPYRYLGIHCRVEDALDYDDRIYPRASSRLGPRHQANVIIWHGQPLELVKPAEIKRKYMKGPGYKKDTKLSKETIAAIEAEKIAREKRPKWVVDEPHGYVRRGEDHPNADPKNTAKLRWRMPEVGDISVRGGEESNAGNFESPEAREKLIDNYMKRARGLAQSVGVKDYNTNFLDKALEILMEHKYKVEPALHQLQHISRRKDLKEPELNKEELKRFEDGIAKYGSNLYEVARHIGKNHKTGDIVRYYYMWKKTDRGKEVWGNYDGRKNKKPTKPTDSALVDDVADDYDDSAFDNDKIATKRRQFECKFCSTKKSPQWRRAPGTAPGTTVSGDGGSKQGKEKGIRYMVALCQRCAGLWRKYAIQWENIDEVAKKVAQAGGRAWKRKMDEELLIELVNANEASSVGMSTTAVAAAAAVGIDVPPALTIGPEEAARKKQKLIDTSQPAQPVVPPEPPKKKVIEKPPEAPIVPDQPRIRTLPCAVCNEMEPMGEEHFCCRHCRLTVHRNCYGIPENRAPSKWVCDTCANDSRGDYSTSYECALCPVRHTESELMEPPKASHKKKSDREREKDRLEKELVVAATEQYRRTQELAGRPFDPREPLKRTSGNNWIHVVCAIWTPGIKFGEAKHLEPSEGLGSVPLPKYQQDCKICKESKGVCVTCHKCPSTFHVACAQRAGYQLGFDVTPVKSSRRDVVSTVKLGDMIGTVDAVIYCKDHAASTIKDVVHPMSEVTDETTGLNALQLYVRNFKQADLSLTGTVRKAAIINSSTRASTQATTAGSGSHRASISNSSANGTGAAAATRSSRVSPAAVTVKSEEFDGDGDRVVHLADEVVLEPASKECSNCGTETSPKWHKSVKPATLLLATAADQPTVPSPDNTQTAAPVTNGHTGEDLSNGREQSVQPPGPSVNGLDGQPKTNGVHPNGDTMDVDQKPEHSQTAKPSQPDTIIEYLCHKCHLKKLKEPSPRAITPLPLPVSDDPLHGHDPTPAEVLQARSPTNWALPPPPGPPQVRPTYEVWPPLQGPSQPNGPMRMPNGMSQMGPMQGPPPIPSQYSVPPIAQYRPNGHEHQQAVRPIQQQPPPPPQPQRHPNGSYSPYQAARRIPDPSPHQPYRPNGRHSPPGNYRNVPPPSGPPRPSENPFYTPGWDTSPRQQHYYGNHGVPHGRPHGPPHGAPHGPPHGSPHGPPHVGTHPHGPLHSPHGQHGSPRLPQNDRPETPTDAMARNNSWTGSEAQMTNGASANPSLRNLLH